MDVGLPGPLPLALFDGTVGVGTLLLLLLCLGIALAFEFVNGFHDTANAVATVIYTHSLKPRTAVLWSGLMNLVGVLSSGGAVAYSIVHLLPVDLLISIGSTAGNLMVLSLLISAIVWNVGTWYFGLPASSSHALIGSILGVGLASSLFSGAGFGSGVNWAKARDVGASLLFSPLFGFCAAGLLLLLLKAFVQRNELFREPVGEALPPMWVRAILFLTCTLVSFFHGSNDGQKGIGLIMLILIGVLPAQYALNTDFTPKDVETTRAAVVRMREVVSRAPTSPETSPALDALNRAEAGLSGVTDFRALSNPQRADLRTTVLEADEALGKWEKAAGTLPANDAEAFKTGRGQLRKVTDYIVFWVTVAVALALGLGTTVGWKRIVVTVGEKIGKTHLNYAQGAAAEMVAAVTIGLADGLGLPVSTTHVLSSGVAGTMAANRSGLQAYTVRNIALAWILTLPVTLTLSGALFAATANGAMKEAGAKARVKPRQERVLPRIAN